MILCCGPAGVKQLASSMAFPFSKGFYPELEDWNMQTAQFNASYVSCSVSSSIAHLASRRTLQPGMVMLNLIANVSEAKRSSFEAFMATQVGIERSTISPFPAFRPSAPSGNASSYLPFMFGTPFPQLSTAIWDLVQTADALSIP